MNRLKVNRKDKVLKTRTPVFLFLFFFYFYCFGQSYLVHWYSESDGLPSSTANDVFQDHQGRMWFATRAGIAVYDGVSWEKYDNTSTDLPVASFTKIMADPRGRIWALSDSKQGGIFVVYLEEGSGERGPGATEAAESRWIKMNPLETDIAKSANVTSFQVGTQGPRDHYPPIVVGTEKNGLFILNRGKWENITKEHGLLSNTVNGIVFLEETQTFYLATENGLSTLNIKGSKITIDNGLNRALGFPAKIIKGIGIEYNDKYPDTPLSHTRVWLYGHRWLGYFEVGRAKMAALFPVELALGNKERAVNLQPDYRTGIYAGNHYELNYFNVNTRIWERSGVLNGIIGGGANSLAIDFEKNIWIAGDRGVSKIVGRRFSNFQQIHGLLEDEVTAVLEIEPGRFILGHNRGITLYNGKKFRKIPFPETKVPNTTLCRVLAMHPDSRKNTWMALAWAGLAKVTPQGKITWYGKKERVPAYIADLWIDEKDNVWAASEEGIFYLTPQGFVPVNIGNFADLNPRRIYGSGEKLRFIATYDQGIFVYGEETGRWENYRVPDDQKINNVYAIKKDSRGRLLVGTLNGLYTLENQGLKKFASAGFHVDKPVYIIMEDRQHRLWIGTDSGVVRWDGKEENSYSRSEGMIGQETNRDAIIQDTRGRIWIGTDRGVSIYDGAFDDSNSFKPEPGIRLTHLETSKKKIFLHTFTARNPGRQGEPGVQPIRLHPSDNTLVFHFRGISFLDETAVRFKSKLAGFDKEWSAEEYPYMQMIRYTNLSPGVYRFHLKARNGLGVWGQEVTSPEIIILQHFYRTWWFFLGISLLAGFVFYGIFRLFTAKRQAALLEKEVEKRTDQLQAVEKRYRSLFEESRDVVFISTPEGKLIDMNPAGLELFGLDYLPEGDALDMVFIDAHVSPEVRAAFREAIATKGYVKDYEVPVRGKDGEKINLLVTATLVRDKSGQVTAYRGMMRDITRQKRLEQQLVQAHKMEAIGTLAGGIAHDFNNILGVILGYMELLLDDLPKHSTEHQYAQQVLTAAERAKDLVKQILAFSRASKGEYKPVKFSAIIDEALRLLRSTLPTTIEIRRHIRVNPDSDIILADATQIHQVMMNLGTNAAHAMRKNGGLLEVIMEELYIDSDEAARNRSLKPGPYLRLTVSDTGHGIPPELMKRIFDPFFTTKEPGEGTGMGLAVTHGIITNHGGYITAYSQPGKGTTFHIYLPKVEEESESVPKPSGEIPGGNERILLIDDEINLAQVGKQMLERLGYRVVGKSSALEALETFRCQPQGFDLIISDVTMPQMTGIQLAIEAKHIREEIPIILCSGFSTIITMEEMKSIGIDDFVMKPIVKSELARVVRNVLDEKKKNRN
jgi:two-component system cell cycle sensor histidine kinase/response regulator CckA